MSKIKHIRKRIYISTVLCLAVGVIGGFIMWSISNFHTGAPHKSASEESSSLPAENADDFLMSEEEKKKWDKTIELHVKNYENNLPIVGIDVVVKEPQMCVACLGCNTCYPKNPIEVWGKTDVNGFASFTVPNLKFNLTKFTVPGYLSTSAYIDSRNMPTISVRQEVRTEQKRIITLFLIPESMLTIKTEEEAVAAARATDKMREWLKYHPDAVLDTHKSDEARWDIRYSIPGGGFCWYFVRTIDGATQQNGSCLH